MTSAALYAATTRQGIALMDARRGRGRWHFLDPVGAQLWLQISSGTAPADAVDALTAHWEAKGANPEQVRADLTALAAELATAGLLRAAHRPAPRPDAPSVWFAAKTRVGVLRQLAGCTGLLAALVLLRCLPVRCAGTAARAATRLPGRRVTWVVGARFTSHGAHAWIETDGHVIGQDETTTASGP